MPTQLNIDRIINATPQKRFINAYNAMKGVNEDGSSRYTKESAESFFNTYENQALSFILDNSRYIFSESYYGTDFYKDCINSNFFTSFSQLGKEYEKVNKFLTKNKNKMGSAQKLKIESVLRVLEDKIENSIGERVISESIADKYPNFEKRFGDEKTDERKAFLIESLDDPMIYVLYTPFLESAELINTLTEKMLDKVAIKEEEPDISSWSNYTEAVVAANRLAEDMNYRERIAGLNHGSKVVYNYLMNRDLFTDLKNTRIKVFQPPVAYENAEDAIDSLLTDAITTEKFSNDGVTESKARLEDYERIAYETTSNVIANEYRLGINKENKVVGYSLINEEASLEETALEIFEEESKKDKDDKLDIDKSPSSKKDQDEIMDDIKNKPIKSHKEGGSAKPPKESTANRIKNKAMDAEARQMDRMSKTKKKATEIANAGKAVGHLGSNILGNIKKMAKDFETADEERKKKRMLDPGYRKILYKYIIAAIEYGTAYHINIALVPVTFLIRYIHHSGDRRIRNELVRELHTELKICDEKINDANANGDRQEKYRLMRIRDKLDAEVSRVRYNSAYI